MVKHSVVVNAKARGYVLNFFVTLDIDVWYNMCVVSYYGYRCFERKTGTLDFFDESLTVEVSLPKEVEFSVGKAVFEKWSDGETSNTRTLKMNQDYNLTAYYSVVSWHLPESIIPKEVFLGLIASGITSLLVWGWRKGG